jgi:hypothetical protein
MPRVSAKARRQALAARIARELFTGGTGHHATRLALMVPVPDDTLLDGKPSERAVGGWGEKAAAAVIEAHLRPGQRRRRAR